MGEFFSASQNPTTTASFAALIRVYLC